MARSYETSSTSKSRRQEEDARRMAFRRAIESRCEQRRLMAELVDFPELHTLRAGAMDGARNAQPSY